MITMVPYVASMAAKGRSDSMFFDPGLAAEGTDAYGLHVRILVDGGKRFMVANKVYENGEATEAILRWTSTNACLEAFLGQKILWCQERNFLVAVYDDGRRERLRTTDIALAVQELSRKKEEEMPDGMFAAWLEKR